jgi:hypothetical protein
MSGCVFQLPAGWQAPSPHACSWRADEGPTVGRDGMEGGGIVQALTFRVHKPTGCRGSWVIAKRVLLWLISCGSQSVCWGAGSWHTG